MLIRTEIYKSMALNHYIFEREGNLFKQNPLHQPSNHHKMKDKNFSIDKRILQNVRLK